jgi:SAM-dependent methyltransferase
MLQVARTPAAVAYKRHVLAEMQLGAGLTVVDVGCGPGTDLQDAADLVPSGLVVGLDLDQRMLAAVPRSTGAAPVAGDAHRLPFATGSIDRLRTDRALQHVRNPAHVLQEFHRVLRPGGIAVLAEPDWRSLVIDGGRTDVANRFVDYTCERVVRNASVGSEAARLGQSLGFTASNVVAFPAVLRDMTHADKVFGLTRNAVAAASAGYLTRDAADEWLADLARGPVLVAVTLFVTTLVVRMSL